LPQRREHDQLSVRNTRRSRDNRLGIVLIWATTAAALVEIKSAAATRVMRRKVFFMVQRNSAVYRGTFNRRASSVPPCWRALGGDLPLQ
jgi:hypothetical protein